MKANTTGIHKECAGCNYSLPSFHRTIQPLWRVQLPPPNSHLHLLLWPFPKQAPIIYRTCRIFKGFHSSIKLFLISRSEWSKSNDEPSVHDILYIWRFTCGCMHGHVPYVAKGAQLELSWRQLLQQAGYLTSIYSHHYYFGDIISFVCAMRSLWRCNI